MGDRDELGDFDPDMTDESQDEEKMIGGERPTPNREENGYNTGRQDAVSSGAKVRAKIKRGTDTRDQDELVVEGRGATGAEAVQDFDAALREIERRGVAERLREIDAERDEGDHD